MQYEALFIAENPYVSPGIINTPDASDIENNFQVLGATLVAFSDGITPKVDGLVSDGIARHTAVMNYLYSHDAHLDSAKFAILDSISPVAGSVTSIQGNVQFVRDDIAALSQQLVVHEASLQQHKTDSESFFTNSSSALSQIQSQIAGIVSSIQGLESALANLSGKVDGLVAGVNGVDSKVVSVQNSVTNSADTVNQVLTVVQSDLDLSPVLTAIEDKGEYLRGRTNFALLHLAMFIGCLVEEIQKQFVGGIGDEQFDRMAEAFDNEFYCGKYVYSPDNGASGAFGASEIPNASVVDMGGDRAVEYRSGRVAMSHPFDSADGQSHYWLSEELKRTLSMPIRPIR